MLYVRSSELIHVIAESLYPFSLFLPTTNVSPAFYSISEFDLVTSMYKWHHVVVTSLLLSGIFHLSLCSQGPSMFWQMEGFPSYSWMSNIPLYIYTLHLCPFIHQWTLTLSPLSWQLWTMLQSTWGVGIVFSQCFVSFT